MTAAMIRTVSIAKPVFTKPSEATLKKIETVLTIALVAQMIGLTIRYII